MNPRDMFLRPGELSDMGFKSIGDNICVSKTASFYSIDNIELGSNIFIGHFCIIAAGSFVKLGDNVIVSDYCALYGGSGISVGSYSVLQPRVSIYSESDDYSGSSVTNPMVSHAYKELYHKGEVNIGNFSSIGPGVSILPGVKIGEGCHLNPLSLVAKSCVPWSQYSGITAKCIGKLQRDKKEVKLLFNTFWEEKVRDCYL